MRAVHLTPLLVQGDDLGHLPPRTGMDGAASRAAVLQRFLGLALQPPVEPELEMSRTPAALRYVQPYAMAFFSRPSGV